MTPKKIKAKATKPRTLHAAPTATTLSGPPTIAQVVYRHVRSDGVGGPDVTIQVGLSDDTDESFLAAAKEIRSRRDQLQRMTDAEFTAATTPKQ